MNRRNFLKNCACGVCSCAAVGPLVRLAEAADPKPAEDWRLGFVQARYGKLLELLSSRMSEDQLEGTLQDLGRFCASGMELPAKHRGHIDDFIREFGERSGESVSFDRAKGVITVVGPERDGCFCPLVNARTCPKAVCACSLGWQAQVYETILGQPVAVTLKESVVRGGKRCTFEIRLKSAAG